MSVIIPKDKKEEHVKYIKSNFYKHSQREIARKLKVGKTTINRWSNEVGLKFKKHAANSNFFDRLNEESAYILGLIFADGNISWDTKKGYYTLTITAAKKDKEHLERIRQIMSSTKPLIYAVKTKSYRLIINDKKLCKRLMYLGVIPKKSLIVKFPQIPKVYLRHFIRGVIDGDGNIRYVKRQRSPYFEITIASGSTAFCEGFIKAIKDCIGIDANIRKVGQNTKIIQYSCSRGEKLAEYIYAKANIFLERKYKEYERFRRN
ncbi:MAG: LAGLIDADG family homing endonuclease [Candidatus Woesearchaeota archaeon]